MAEEKMRLWEVEVTVRVMVVAATRQDAERFAENDTKDCVSDTLFMGSGAQAHEPTSLDPDVANTLPWVDDDDGDAPEQTCAVWFLAGAEERAEAKRLAEFNARQVPLPIG